MTADVMALKPPKRVPVNGSLIRWYHVQQVADSVVAANIGALIVAGLYYATTQMHYRIPAFSFFGGHLVLHHGFTLYYVKHGWDGLFPQSWWPVYRHGLRDLYEPIVATFFVKSLMAKWKRQRQHTVGPRELVARAVLVIAVSLPLVILGLWLVNYSGPALWHQFFHHHKVGNPVHLPHGLSFAGTYLGQWPWQLLLIGVIIGQVVHKIYAPVGATVQGFFLDRQLDKARDGMRDDGLSFDAAMRKYRPKFPVPPEIRERFEWVMVNDLPVRDRGHNIAGVVRIMTAVALILLIIGIYARYWVAKGH